MTRIFLAAALCLWAASAMARQPGYICDGNFPGNFPTYPKCAALVVGTHVDTLGDLQKQLATIQTQLKCLWSFETPRVHSKREAAACDAIFKNIEPK